MFIHNKDLELKLTRSLLQHALFMLKKHAAWRDTEDFEQWKLLLSKLGITELLMNGKDLEQKRAAIERKGVEVP